LASNGASKNISCQLKWGKPDIFVYPSLGAKFGIDIGRIPQNAVVEILDSKTPPDSLYP
jgi:hypothetical protein